MNLRIKDWNIEAVTGYKPKTTFYMDFSIADNFGKSAIMDTYKRAFNAWKKDTEYLTELVMALNWKIWEHYDTEDEDIARLYNDLWLEAQDYAYNNLTGDDLKYFLRTID